MRTTVERFWRKVDRTGNCWLWTGAIGQAGYGSFQLDGRLTSAHRASFQLFVAGGPIPGDLWVLHSCDVKACVRPSHLRLGTRLDNARDAAERRRLPYEDRNAARRPGFRAGERNAHAKLTDEDVAEIRRAYAAGALQRHIAVRFGIRQNTVSQIVNGKLWKHLQVPATEKAARLLDEALA